MKKNVVLSSVDVFVYWYIYEATEKWFVENLGERFHLELLVYEHWFMSIIISHIKDHYISVYQARYATSIVDKYLDTAKVNTSTKFYRTTFPSDMILTEDDASTSG